MEQLNSSDREDKEAMEAKEVRVDSEDKVVSEVKEAKVDLEASKEVKEVGETRVAREVNGADSN